MRQPTLMFFALLLAACAGGATLAVPWRTTPEADAIVAAEDRSEADRARDALRHPAEMLTFMGVRSGMRVADLAAGAGYSTELLARAVGPSGQVYGQNDRRSLERFHHDAWAARLALPVNRRVVRVDREFSDPLPPDVQELDLVSFLFGYHDAVDRGATVSTMNARIFSSLRPGGAYVVADHHAREGSGTTETSRYHRIDRATVIEQVERAGFVLVDEAFFLRDGRDTRDWAVYTRGFVTDRFVLKFRRP